MMMIDGGKDKYMNLLTLVKHESPQLYEIIQDLCLDGTFRTQKHQNTFLMPNDKLVKHIKSLVDNDEDLTAIDIIRSLLLKGHYSVDSFKNGAMIGTLQFGSRVLADPEAVGKAVSESKKVILVTKDHKYATVVLHYKSDSAPKTMEGKADAKSGGMVPLNMISGGVTNQHAQKVKDLARAAIVKDDHKKTLTNFFKLVSAALHQIKSDSSRFDKAKCYLAANPVLSWFFLTMPGSSKSLIRNEDMDQIEATWNTITDYSIIEIAVKYDLDVKFFKSKTANGTNLKNNCDLGSLCSMIESEYKKQKDGLLKAHAIDNVLSEDIHLKIRMDELRFIYDGAVDDASRVDDMITELGDNGNYVNPRSKCLFTDSELYSKNLIKGSEAFTSGPKEFVSSVYFLYTPLTEEVVDKLLQLLESRKGGSEMGSSNIVSYNGGAARKMMKKKSSELKLASFVKILSADQRKALKEML